MPNTEKRKKELFRPANGMPSTHSLVEIHNKRLCYIGGLFFGGGGGGIMEAIKKKDIGFLVSLEDCRHWSSANFGDSASAE